MMKFSVKNTSWMSDILDYYKSTVKDARSGFTESCGDFDHAFGTEKRIDLDYEGPEIENIEIRLDLTFPFSCKGEVIRNIYEMRQYISAYVETEINVEKLKLELRFYIKEYLDNHIKYLGIEAEWVEE